MPWFCPACHTEIRNHDTAPHRCEVCRLELVFDGQSGRMRLLSHEKDEMLVRPTFDRRRNPGTPPPEGDRRRKDRRQSRLVH